MTENKDDKLLKMMEKGFVLYSKNGIIKYIEIPEHGSIKLKAQDGQLVSKEVIIGKVYAEQELLKYKKEGENYSQNTAQLLYQQLEKEKNAELANHESKEEPITADDAAELSLLSSIKLTVAEMREYLEKYKNKPLALRKLEDIMDNDTTLAYIEIDMEQFSQQQRLEKLVHFLDRKIDYFHGGLLINGDKIDLVQHEMIVEGNSEAMDAELQNYLA